MNNPRRYLIRMLLFIVAVLLAIVGLYTPLSEAFMANPALNGLILGVLVLGVIYIFRQVILLMQEVAWIEIFAKLGRSLFEKTLYPSFLLRWLPCWGNVGTNSVYLLCL